MKVVENYVDRPRFLDMIFLKITKILMDFNNKASKHLKDIKVLI